ncbi:MAG: cytochrome c-type biogenesis protein CcmH [Chloroflexi bacterium]|nr:cytochrome c-type biogenesis protein CcmH [Chloroflexota bacterium]
MNVFDNMRRDTIYRVPTFLIFLLLLLALAVPVTAQNSPTSGTVTADDVNAIAKQMYCPVCENIPLDVCSTAACAQWRDEIRIQLQQGRTEQEIKNDFVARYGDRVLGTPQDPTLRALSLVTPWMIAALVALVAAVVLVRWWRGRGTAALATTGSVAAPSDDDYRARLERDLQARR